MSRSFLNTCKHAHTHTHIRVTSKIFLSHVVRALFCFCQHTINVKITFRSYVSYFSVKPMSVTILSNEHTPLSAGRKYDINCITVGSRPPAKLSWYMNGKKLNNHTEKVRCFFFLLKIYNFISYKIIKTSLTL